jgi:hypothetical protein
MIFTIHKKNISRELLSQAKLIKANEFVKSDYDTNRILNEIFSSFSLEGENNQSEKTETTNNNNNNTIKLRVSKNETGLTSEKSHEINLNDLKINQSDLIDISQLEKPYKNIYHTANSKMSEDFGPQSSADCLTFDNSFFYSFYNAEIGQKLYDSELMDNLLNVNSYIKLASNG